MAEESIQSPEQLGKLLDGKTDAEIVDGVTAMGVDNVLGRVFQGMVEHFLPERAVGQTATAQYDVKLPSGEVHSYQVRVKDGACSFAKDKSETPRVTLELALPDFLRIISGKLNGMQAFMAGKLKPTGDVMFAQIMLGWFKQPPASTP